ncbi:MAG: 2-amino-4-hydroxy-6-hydroxymethyldihydropteridine diphosphokinase [Chloroflexota bacterium]
MNAVNHSQVFLSIGSNIDPEKNLPAAIKWLAENFSVTRVSSVWQTEAIGSGGPDFLNAVILIETALLETELKNIFFRWYEEKIGRVRDSNKNAPRQIDIDILIFNNQIVEDEIWEYAHKAVPLAEIYPDLEHPTSNQSLLEIAAHLQSDKNIYLRDEINLDF